MDAASPAHCNRLINETSPYLQQHAHNPVDWYPWGEAALAKARAEDKPILLSIGYSACHWCHVMAHESFEDEAIARVMNELFVNIKVDREERPDLDKIYQTAHQMLAQRGGGWPLTMFLTADDQTPFFGGTYFPNTARHGLPAFADLLRRVAAYYREQRGDVLRQNAALREAFSRIEQHGGGAGAHIDGEVLARARADLGAHHDARYGGFGGAPKFPHPTHLERLLRHWAAQPTDREALEIALHTLSAMGAGGIYDQLGGGFYRYSVDERWMIPHFEKMLYDNALLLAVYTDAFVASGDAFYRRIARETGEWAQREMQSPAGGYYSSLDADSEGREGKFYVWRREQVRPLLTDDEYAAFAARFGLDRPANFEGEWHLHTYAHAGAIAKALDRSADDIVHALDTARAKLFAAREQRVRPARDEKILTAWNGLMIKGMARAGRFLDRADFIDSARRALDHIRAQLWRDGRLLATAKDGHAHLNAYLDDYAFLADGVLELVQAGWRDGDLEFAIALMDTVLEHFADGKNGGFFFTSDDHERLAFRPKPVADEAIPASNGIATQVLLRLGHLLGETRYLQAAEDALRALYPQITQYPSAHDTLLVAVEEWLAPPQTLVLRGARQALSPWLARAHTDYAPRRLTLAIPSEATCLPGLLGQRVAGDGVRAYLCQGHTCGPPLAALDAYAAALAEGETAKIVDADHGSGDRR